MRGDTGEPEGWAARLVVGSVVLWLGDRGRYWPRKRALLIGGALFLNFHSLQNSLLLAIFLTYELVTCARWSPIIILKISSKSVKNCIPSSLIGLLSLKALNKRHNEKRRIGFCKNASDLRIDVRASLPL